MKEALQEARSWFVCYLDQSMSRNNAESLAEEVLAEIDKALAQPVQERNFCSRCGKRTADLTVIHTCTPPQEKT